MPITRKWKIEEVIQAAGRLQGRPRERVTFEYVLLGGLNDGLQQADGLGRPGARCADAGKGKFDRLEPTSRDQLLHAGAGAGGAFQQRLIARGVPAFLRRPRGRDIYAACGQLKRTVDS